MRPVFNRVTLTEACSRYPSSRSLTVPAKFLSSVRLSYDGMGVMPHDDTFTCKVMESGAGSEELTCPSFRRNEVQIQAAKS